MKLLAAVALGGACGAVARYGVFLLASHLLGTQFPYGTLLVNVIGSFIMGVLVELMALSVSLSAELRLLLTTGILGAFTTFSTFSLDVAVLYERGKLLLCAVYIVLSLSLSIGALFAGLQLVRRCL